MRELIALTLWSLIVVGTFSAAATAATFSGTHVSNYVTVVHWRIETAPARIAWIVLNLLLATGASFASRWHTTQWDAELARRPHENAAPRP
jgi:hypothetical protein